MQKNLKKLLSLVLTLVMVLSITVPAVPVSAADVTKSTDLPTAMEGLSIAYPYNTENIELTEAPVSRFDALTFESARNEVESAQMILTPNFMVDSFELTMNDLTSEKGNIIPAWAFEVFVQHYIAVEGAGNYANYGQFETLDSGWLNKEYSDNLYHPRAGESAPDGVYPDALIPQDAAIANGVNTVAAGNNKGIWVNLNVQDAAPGTYTGFATLNVNGSDMQIPVSVRIYDVEIPDEVHSIMSTGIWWDQLEAGEGYMNQTLADSYYDYLISKRISPWNRYNYWYTTEGLVTNVVEMASNPSIPAYLLYYTTDSADIRKVDRASVVTTLTALINKNIELVNAGNNVDLFAKAYFYFTNVDEPAGGSNAPTYAQVQAAINVLDSVKGELASMLDAYPSLKESFLDIKNVVTGPNPTDDAFYIDGCPDYSNSSELTSTYDSVIYCPQFQYMQTAEQRAIYANDEEVWWYGCCHPVAPYPTFHYNTPLVNNRALGFMMYEYDIAGMVYSSVNYWGSYTDGGIALHDYWNGYESGTPGDQMLVYPGSDYGVDGPIGSMRIETIREGSEDYEYLWLLERFGGNISAYTAGLYDGAIVTGTYDGHTVDPDGDGNTDSNVIYHSRRTALLSKLEELNVAANGATEIAPGQENFVRGTAFDAGVGTIVRFDEADYAGIVFDYKLTNDGDIAVTLRSPNDVPYYGVYYFVASGELHDYSGITTETLSDGYVRVTMNTAMMDYTNSNINRDNVPATLNKLDILSWGSAGGYVDNVQLLTDAADIYTPETKADDLIHMTVFDNATYTTAAYYYVDNYVKAEGSTAALKVNTASNVHLCWDLRKEDGGMLDLANGTLSAYFYFANGNPYAEAQFYDNSWASARAQFTFEDVGGGWYYGTLKTNAADLTVRDLTKTILLRLWFTSGTTVYIDGMSFEKLVDKNDIFTGGSWVSGSSWTSATNMTYTNNCTEVYGEDSISSWKFSATAANTNQWAQFLMGMTQAYDMRDYYFEFDAKVDGVDSQKLSLRPRTGADGAKDPCGNTVLNLTSGWNTYTVDFSTALYPSSSVEDLAVVQRIFMVFDFAATTGTDRSVIIDNVRLVKKECQHTNTTTTTVDATCTAAGSVTVTCDACGETISTEVLPVLEHSYSSVVTAPTFTTNGYTTYTCSGCGDSYDGDETPVYTASVKEWNIALGDEISATFYLNIDSRLENADVNVTVGANSVSSELIKTEDGAYTLTVKAAAAQMTDEITISVVSGDLVSQEMTYTIRQYADYILEGDYTESTKSLVKAMLNYGAAAQTYFGYNDDEDSLANKGYENTEAIEIPTVDSSNMVSGSAEGVRFYGASLVFESKVAVRFYFTVTGEITSYSVGNAPVEKNGLYYIEVPGINPQDYAKDITLTLNDTLTVTYSPLTYISRKSASDNAELAALVKAMYSYHLAAVKFVEEAEMRGEAFVGGVTKTIYLPTDAIDNLVFDYKLTSEGTMHIVLRAGDWNGFYGDFAFNADGETVDYDGIVTEKLEDGYIRVTVRFEQLGRTGCVNNRDSAPASVGIFDVYEFGTADGYVDNIQLDVELPEEEDPAEPEIPAVPAETTAFAAGTGKFIVVDTAYESITFDYQLDGEGVMGLILRDNQDWTKYYGGYYFNNYGESIDYEGVTTEVLGNGYIRATLNFAELTVTSANGAPENVEIFDIYGGYTTVSGNFGNVLVDSPEEEPAEPEIPPVPVETTAFAATTGKFIVVDTAYESITFDYQLDGEGVMGLILRDNQDWGKYYGGYYFNNYGESIDYEGVTTKVLGNGYIRATLNFAELTVTSANGAPENVEIFDIYGGYTTVSGNFGNVLVDSPEEEPTEPEIPPVPAETTAFVAGTTKYIVVETTYESITFDYQLEGEGVMGLILRDNQDWTKYYGGYYFNAFGESIDYEGVTTKDLGNGYIRVTLNFAELAVISANGAPENVEIFDIYGAYTTVNGNIGNVKIDS